MPEQISTNYQPLINNDFSSFNSIERVRNEVVAKSFDKKELNLDALKQVLSSLTGQSNGLANLGRAFNQIS